MHPAIYHPPQVLVDHQSHGSLAAAPGRPEILEGPLPGVVRLAAVSAGFGPLVSVDWLSEHLDHSPLRPVDCRWYLTEP
ncbi:MAG: hypothetical protein GWN79_11975, partial [Actinobacteria bacterium]|nr:hypothetical protein [Actinomycetota bacterium]NIS32135.1 hypothetical protein [Actinomycetota bacterium]NIU19760.1 hypothetical protein [Actinomycetota bacterium]NIU67202.1 hypothetical protein [Actinomycetota bacterium]NIV87723.1 hypothetical protein [Actinomycetota bacterium]